MMVGMSLATFTLVHVLISLVAIRFGLRSGVRTARRKTPGRLDGALPDYHGVDQRHRLRLSPSNTFCPPIRLGLSRWRF